MHLSVILLDRFLSRVSVKRNKLQLVGVACLLIASKMEEMRPISLEDCEFGTTFLLEPLPPPLTVDSLVYIHTYLTRALFSA